MNIYTQIYALYIVHDNHFDLMKKFILHFHAVQQTYTCNNINEASAQNINNSSVM